MPPGAGPTRPGRSPTCASPARTSPSPSPRAPRPAPSASRPSGRCWPEPASWAARRAWGRAIDADGEPFEGPYVIGDCSGSYFAHSYPNLCTGYTHGRTCTFARRVAREMNGEEVVDYTVMQAR